MKIGHAVTHWSSPTLRETLSTLPSNTVVVNLKHLGWPLAKGWNEAIKHLLSENDVAIISNDDVIFRPDTSELLAWGIHEGQFEPRGGGFKVEWGGSHPEILLLSARHAAPSDARTTVPDWTLLNSAEPSWQPGPDFACFAVNKRLFEVVGKFDENFGVYHEDNDMHRRIQLAGYEGGAFAPYWHYLNGTIRNDVERQTAIHAIFEKSRNEYIAKWGGYLGQEKYTTPYNGGILV